MASSKWNFNRRPKHYGTRIENLAYVPNMRIADKTRGQIRLQHFYSRRKQLRRMLAEHRDITKIYKAARYVGRIANRIIDWREENPEIYQERALRTRLENIKAAHVRWQIREGLI